MIDAAEQTTVDPASAVPITGFRLASVESNAFARIIAVGVMAVILAAIIAAAGLQNSLQHGRLSIPPVYDDVVYFTAAAEWLAAFPGRPLGASLHVLLGQHAPFATMQGIAGFLLTPHSFVGHYAANAVVIAVFLFGVGRLIWDLPVTEIAVVLLGVACLPMLFQLTNEARPDLAWGLAMGLVIAFIVVRSPSQRSLMSLFWLGILCGLAVAVKPSAILASIVCALFALCASLAADWIDAGHRPTRLRLNDTLLRIAIFVAGAAVILTPVLIVSFSRILGYIWSVLVENRGLWSYNASLKDHVLFYLTGYGGRGALGPWLWVGVVLFALRLALGRRYEDRGRPLLLLIVLVITWIVPTIPTVKTFFLGGMFYGTFIAVIALNLAAIFRMTRDAMRDVPSPLIRHPLARLALPLLFLAVFVKVVVVSPPLLETRFDAAAIRDIGSSSHRLWELLKSDMANQGTVPPRGVTVAFSSPHPVNSETIRLFAVRAALPVTIRGEYFQPTIEDMVKKLKAADFAVVASSRPHQLPGPRMGDEAMRALDEGTGMCIVETIPFSSGVMRVYRKSEACFAGDNAPSSAEAK